MTTLPDAAEASRRRVMLAIDSLDIGGAEEHFVALVNSLVSRGHDVVVAVATAGPLMRRLSCRTHVFARSVKRRYEADYAAFLGDIIERERPALVHAHLYATAVAAADALGDAAIPLVITLHSEGQWMSEFARRRLRRAYESAAAVIGVAAPIVEGARAMSRTPVFHIPNTIWVASEMPKRVTREAMRVGFVGRHVPEKGEDLFWAAAHYVPDAEFVSMTPTTLRNGISGREFISELDVLVVPSRTEGTPFVILEAMAEGTPIVATAVGGIPELARHSHEAILIPPDDSQAIARAVRLLLRDEHLRARLAASAFRRVARQFQLDHGLTRTVAVYRHAFRD